MLGDKWCNSSLTQFKAFPSWVYKFKPRNKIVSRKLTKVVRKGYVAETKKVLEAAKAFINDANNKLVNTERALIINTNQSGFNIELALTRTFSNSGEKDTITAVKIVNTTTHSYTHCTPINQPLDVGFYRQLKIMTKRISTFIQLHQINIDVTSRKT